MFSFTKDPDSEKITIFKNLLKGEVDNFEKQHPNVDFLLKEKHHSISQLLMNRAKDITFADFLKKPSVTDTLTETIQKSKSGKDELLSISNEESLVILKKLDVLSHLPPGLINADEELYITQQLSDMLGFQVVPTINDIHLPHTIVRVGVTEYRLPKTSSVADVPVTHISHKRGYFSWPLAEAQQNAALQYGIVLPLLLLEKNKYIDSLSWFRGKKILLVNPTKNKACVASIIDISADNITQTQALATPNVIRNAELWNTRCQGQALLFFIDDSAQSAEEGIYPLVNQKTFNPKLGKILS